MVVCGKVVLALGIDLQANVRFRDKAVTRLVSALGAKAAVRKDNDDF